MDMTLRTIGWSTWPDPDYARVSQVFACPYCDNDEMDWLLIPDWDCNVIHCEVCGVWYKIEDPHAG